MIGEFYIISRQINNYISKIFNNENDLILDLGCGNKPSYHHYMKGKILCFDKIKTKMTHVIGDANLLPFKLNKFDKAISINSFYYFRNPFDVINNIHKILKKEGKLVLVMPFIYPIHDVPHDNYRFTEFGIKEILNGKFELEEIKSIGGIFNLPAVLFHSLIKGLPLTVPAFLQKSTKILTMLIFYIPYIAMQLLSIIDFLDKTRRWPTYYFVLATKK